MTRHVSWSVVLVLSLRFSTAVAGAQAVEDPLRYTDRGNRWEGIRNEPSSSSTSVELWSAVMEGSRLFEGIPEQPTLWFYLPPDTRPALVVREIEPDLWYWLDRVESEWRPGDWNRFAWPAKEVLRGAVEQYRRPTFGLADLGALVRLDGDTPSIDERVAPASWVEFQPGSPPEAYVFTFLGGTHASGHSCTIRREGDDRPIETRRLVRIRPGTPFSCRWRPGSAEEGEYRLTIEDPEGVAVQTVRFGHVLPIVDAQRDLDG